MRQNFQRMIQDSQSIIFPENASEDTRKEYLKSNQHPIESEIIDFHFCEDFNSRTGIFDAKSHFFESPIDYFISLYDNNDKLHHTLLNQTEADSRGVFDWMNDMRQSDEEMSPDWAETIQSNTIKSTRTNGTNSSHFSEHKSTIESETQPSRFDEISILSVTTNNTTLSLVTCHSEHVVNSCMQHAQTLDERIFPFLDASSLDYKNIHDVNQREAITSFDVGQKKEKNQTSELINQNELLLTSPNLQSHFNSSPNLPANVQIEKACLSSDEETEFIQPSDSSVSTISGQYNLERFSGAYIGDYIGNTCTDKSIGLVDPDYNSSEKLLKSKASVQSNVQCVASDGNNVEQFVLDNFGTSMDVFNLTDGHSCHDENLDRRPDESSSDSSSEIENSAVVEIGDQAMHSSDNIAIQIEPPKSGEDGNQLKTNRPNSYSLVQERSQSATFSSKASHAVSKPLYYHSAYDLNAPEKGKSRSTSSKIAGRVRKALSKLKKSGKKDGSGDLTFSTETTGSKNVQLLGYHQRPRSPSFESSEMTSRSRPLKPRSKDSNKKLEENLRFRPPSGFSSDLDISFSEDEPTSQKSDDEIFAKYIEGKIKDNPTFATNLFSAPGIDDMKEETPELVPRAMKKIENQQIDSESEDTLTNNTMNSSKSSSQDDNSVKAIPRITKANIKGMELDCKSGSLSPVETKKFQDRDLEPVEIKEDLDAALEPQKIDSQNQLQSTPRVSTETEALYNSALVSDQVDRKSHGYDPLNVTDFYEDVTKDVENFDATSSSSSADELAMQIGVKKDAVFVHSDSDNESISQVLSLLSEESNSTLNEVKEATMNLSSEGESDIFDFALLLPRPKEKIQYVVEPLVITDNPTQVSSIYDQGKADDSFLRPVVSVEANTQVSCIVKVESAAEKVDVISSEPSPAIGFLSEFEKEQLNMVEKIDSTLYQVDSNLGMSSEISQGSVTSVSDEETMEDTRPFDEEKFEFQNTTDVTQGESSIAADSEDSSNEPSTPSITAYEVNSSFMSDIPEPILDDTVDKNLVGVTKNLPDEPLFLIPFIDNSSNENSTEVSSEVPGNPLQDEAAYIVNKAPPFSFLGVELQSPPPQFANEILVVDEEQAFESELDKENSSTPISGSFAELSSISSEGALYLQRVSVDSILDGLLGVLDGMGYKPNESGQPEDEHKKNVTVSLPEKVSLVQNELLYINFVLFILQVLGLESRINHFCFCSAVRSLSL